MNTMTIPEVAARLHMSVDSLRDRRNAGTLPDHFNPTRCTFAWHTSDIDLFCLCGGDIKEYRRRKALIDLHRLDIQL